MGDQHTQTEESDFKELDAMILILGAGMCKTCEVTWQIGKLG